MSDSNRKLYVASGVTFLGVTCFVLCLWFYQSFSEYQGKHADQRQNISRYQAETGEKYTDACLKEGVTFYSFFACLANSIDANREAQRSQYDLQAQQEMAEWAYFLVFLTGFGLIASIGGILLLWQNLMQVHKSNAIGEESVAAASTAAEASLLSARATIAELDPLIAFDSATVNSGMILKHQARFSVKIVAHNAGKSVARGFLLTVKHSRASKEGIRGFISECRALERDPEVVILQGLKANHDAHLIVHRNTYDEWLESELKPLRDHINDINERNASIIAEYGPDHNDRGRSIMEATERLTRHEQDCRHSGMLLNIYIVATWIGIEPDTVNFAAQEYRIRNSEGGSINMEKTGGIALGLDPVGGQILGPHFTKKKHKDKKAT